MWIRVRLDVGWRDMIAAAAYCLTPGNRSEAESAANETWGGDESLLALSVRSGFDLALRALELPQGSEVLFSALTVPDMVRIAEAHDLVPVPVDIDEGGQICPESLKRAVTSNSCMVVVAHLFGGHGPMDEVLAIAREHDLLVVEDCAQSFQQVGDVGNLESDLAMLSFGPIKTSTALGGAVVRVRCPRLRSRMKEILEHDPIQRRSAYARRVLRFSVLKMLSGQRTSAWFRRGVEMIGGDFDSLANSLGRGFSASILFEQLRKRPSTPLLWMLDRRWKRFDPCRIQRRMVLGRRLDQRIGRSHDTSHSYWVYPLVTDEPTVVRDRLVASGFDATCLSRMTIVPHSDSVSKPTAASDFWEHVVFLPWYPELTTEAVDEMARVIASIESASVATTVPRERRRRRNKLARSETAGSSKVSIAG